MTTETTAPLASLEDLYADKPATSGTTTQSAGNNQPEPTAPENSAETQAWLEAAKPADKPAQETPAATADKPDKAAKKTEAEGEDEPEPADVVGLKQALKATRQKAREREAKAKEFETQLSQERERFARADQAARMLWSQLNPEQGNQDQQVQVPDPVTQPEEWARYQSWAFQRELEARDQKYQHEIYMAKLVPSQELMRSRHDDYPEVEALFAKTANEAAEKGDNSLWATLRKHPFPAQYAYETGKEIKLRQQIAEAGSLDKYVERIAAEKAKELAGQTQQQAQPLVPSVAGGGGQHAARTPAVPSLARVPSVTPRNTGKSFNGPVPLADLYKS